MASAIASIAGARSSIELAKPYIARHMGCLDTAARIAVPGEHTELAVERTATAAAGRIVANTVVSTASVAEVGQPDFIAVVIRSIADTIAFTSCIIADNIAAIAACIVAEAFAIALVAPLASSLEAETLEVELMELFELLQLA